jgi:hypothetical protein
MAAKTITIRERVDQCLAEWADRGMTDPESVDVLDMHKEYQAKHRGKK